MMSSLARRAGSSCLGASSTLATAGFSTSTYEIKKVGIVGLGLMGHGIAQQAATHGYEVVGIDMSADSMNKGISSIDSSVKKLLAGKVKKGKMEQAEADSSAEEIMSRVSGSTDIEALADCDLVVEAIVENMEVKVPFYQNLGRICKPSTIFGSNTSSLPVQGMADVCGRPDKMIGLHFFNPVQLMKLVEVVATDQTDPAAFEAGKNWVKSIDRVAVSCKDTPGFIVNRLLVPSLAQALLMLDRGDASMQDIDISMQLGAGHPMGPITLADYVGLDTILSILEGWTTNFPDEPAFIVPDSLRKKVQEGKLGRKTGEGFFKWEGNKRVN